MSIISDLVSIPVVVHLLHTNRSVLNYIKNFSYKSRFIFVNFLKTDSYDGTRGLDCTPYLNVHAKQIRKAFCSGTECFPIREIA